jgi:hypothetical protein
VDEENFDWAPGGRCHHPLTAASRAAAPPPHAPLSSEQLPAGSVASAPSTYSRELRFLDLFSGPYSRSDGLSAAMRAAGWKHVEMIDNDGEVGGGWKHDLLNDSVFASMLAKARAGGYDAIHAGFPCSTGALSRLFDAPSAGGNDRGPPMVRDADNPDGLPESELDPKHVRELRAANLLLSRTVALLVVARLSPARTRISFEQPADRSVVGSTAYAPDLSHHGSILATKAVKLLISTLDMKSCTFAYCRLGLDIQKYTTLLYTPDLDGVLGALDTADYQCNHPRGSHAGRVRGREPDGTFTSKKAAAYPAELCRILALAFTRACTGGDTVPSPPALSPPPPSAAPLATVPHGSE